jgi:capsule polysaccharide export protein KpsE/RkpR
MANVYVDELHRQNSRLALTTAGQRRLFFEERVRQEKDALADAEAALKNMQQATGLVYPAGQSDAPLRSIAQIRAEIASREVQAQAMRLYAAPENPQLRAIEEETFALHAQLDKLENLHSSYRHLAELIATLSAFTRLSHFVGDVARPELLRALSMSGHGIGFCRYLSLA